MDGQTKAKAEQYTDIMLEHMPVGVALYDIHDFRLLMANPLYHKFLDNYLGPAMDGWKGNWTSPHGVATRLQMQLPLWSIFRTVAETGRRYQAVSMFFRAVNVASLTGIGTLDPIHESEGTRQFIAPDR